MIAGSRFLFMFPVASSLASTELHARSPDSVCKYARFDITLDGARADGSVQGLVPDISISLGGPVERLRVFPSK